MKFYKKSFNVDYNNCWKYPTTSETKEAIAIYCAKNNHNYEFISDDTVIIDGVEYAIERGPLIGGRGSYGIKCIQK